MEIRKQGKKSDYDFIGLLFQDDNLSSMLRLIWRFDSDYELNRRRGFEFQKNAFNAEGI